MTLPGMDGIIRLRTLTRGGAQIESRLFPAHTALVLAAWRQRHFDSADGDVFRVDAEQPVLQLKRVRA